MEDEIDIKDSISSVKRIIKGLDIRGLVIIILILLNTLMFSIANYEIRECNSYWLNKTADRSDAYINNPYNMNIRQQMPSITPMMADNDTNSIQDIKNP